MDAVLAFHDACREGDTLKIENYLISLSDDKYFRRCDAFFQGFLLAASSGQVPILDLLLSGHHVRVDAADNDGDTALTFAVCDGQSAAVLFLLQKGADCNTPNRRGYTPLAAALQAKDLSLISLLVAEGGDAGLPDGDGYPFFSTADSSVVTAIREGLRQRRAATHQALTATLGSTGLAALLTCQYALTSRDASANLPADWFAGLLRAAATGAFATTDAAGSETAFRAWADVDAKEADSREGAYFEMDSLDDIADVDTREFEHH
jgi:hypothetical protein